MEPNGPAVNTDSQNLSDLLQIGPPTQDKEIARRFFQLLTGEQDPEIRIKSVRDSESATGFTIEREGPVDWWWADAIAAQANGHGIFYFVNAMKPGPGSGTWADGTSNGYTRGEDAIATRMLAIDCDTGLPELWHIQPSLIVHTSKKAAGDGTTTIDRGQGIWPLQSGTLALTEFKSAQVRLARLYGADESVSDLVRVLRVPGFLHLKDRDNPQLVTFDDHTDGKSFAAYALAPERVLVGVPEVDVTTASKSDASTPPGVEWDMPVNVEACNAKLRKILADGPVGVEGDGKNGRDNVLFRAAAFFRDRMISDELTVKMLWETLNPQFMPPYAVIDDGSPQSFLHPIRSAYSGNTQNKNPGTKAQPSFEYTFRNYGEKLRAEKEQSQAENDANQRSKATDGELDYEKVLMQGTEIHISSAFCGMHYPQWRYVPARKEWLHFDGHRWQPDTTLHVWELIKRLTATYAYSQGKPTIASRKVVAAVEGLARSDARIAAQDDLWDADPQFLNTPGGVVDLRTGVMRPAVAEDYLTKQTAVAPRGDCPLFKKFLAEITEGDEQKQAYLQRLFGYALTGSTVEHVMAFFVGSGGNGKSVLLNVLAGAMGDYAMSAPAEMFSESKYDRHPTELAMLAGARLVVANETEESRYWAEARLKALTGGDKIRARKMRQDFSEFVPQFKLIIAGNHKPRLHTVDPAIKRRLHIVPFTFQVRGPDIDPDLPEKLKAEWPGILAWMIQGCQQYRLLGLAPPPAVLAATNDYLVGQDLTAEWLDDRCVTDPQAWTSIAMLYSSYDQFMKASGERPKTKIEIAEWLKQRGFVPRHAHSGRGFVGVRLRTIGEDTAAPPTASANAGAVPANFG